MRKFLILIFTLFASLMFFACGEEKITIEFDSLGGSAISNVEIELEKIADFKLPEAPVKEGFKFDGWYLDADFTKEFVSLEGLEGTIKLYAKWVEESVNVLDKTYKVSFYVDGALLEEYNGSAIALTYPEIKEVSGKSFFGWYEDSECTKLFAGLGTNEEITLYGKYVDVPTDSIAVKYVVNGTSYVNEIVKKNEFALNAPSFDDAKFSGWYTDKYLSNEFTSIDEVEFVNENEVVLYGVKLESINGVYTFNTDFSLETATQGISQKGEASVQLVMEYKNFNLLDLANSEMHFQISIDSNDESLNVNEYEEVHLYLKESKVYLYNPAESEQAYIDLTQVLPLVKEFYKMAIIEMEAGKDSIENNEELSSASKLLTEYLMNLELTAEQKTELNALVETLKPVEVVNGSSTSYTITDAQIQSFVSKLGDFVTKHFKDLFGEIFKMFMGYSDVESTKEYVDEFGNKFVSGEAGWYDANEKFHSYAEDTEFDYGMISDTGYYVPYYAYGYVFDTNDNYKAIKGELSYNFDTFEEVLITYEPDGWYEFVDGEKVFHNISEDFENQAYGWVEEGYYYSPSGNIYNITTGEVVSQEELIDQEIDAVIAEMSEAIKLIDTFIKANVLKSTVTIYDNNEGFKIELNGDIDFTPFSTTGEEIVTNYKLNYTYEVKISYDVPSINYPSFDGALDITNELLNGFGEIGIPEINDAPAFE